MRRALALGLALAGSLAAATLAHSTRLDASLQAPTSVDPTFGKPITIAVSGSTPGPNEYPGRTEYELALVLRPVSKAPCGEYEYDALTSSNGSVVVQTWDVSNANGAFTRVYKAVPTSPDSPDSIEPGRYRACAWLWNVQVEGSLTGGHGLLAMQQSSIAVREPRFSVSVRALGTFTIQHFPVPFDELRYTPVVVDAWAEVGRGRTVVTMIVPPGVHRCPSSLLRSYYAVTTSVLVKTPGGHDAVDQEVRAGGPHSYRTGLVVVDVAGRPGRSLLCAGIYDGNDTTAPAGEEAAAQTWVTVKPKPR